MSDIKIGIEDIYINLIMMSILRQRNFEKLVLEAEEELELHKEEITSFLPDGYDGLYFVELLSRKMGSTLGEVYSLSQERKEEIIIGLIENIKKDDIKCSFYDDSDQTSIRFEITASVMDTSDESKILRYYHDLHSEVTNNDNDIFVYYLIIFQRNILDDVIEYNVSMTGRHSFNSNYVYDEYDIWCGNEGPIAKYIDEVVENHKISLIDSYTDDEDDAEDESEGLSVIEVEKPIIESEPVQEGPKIVDELIQYIFDTTKTIDLLDKFEGYGQDAPIRYRRIVIENCNYRNYSIGHGVGFNLVIERGRGSDYVGNVTFTEFKKGEAYELSRYIEEEITEEIINKYVDTDQFYRFTKPYLLRAQNSSNRTGYGWEWDWSGGYGDYTEGTLYGETTNYFFVGAYITSDYSYNPDKRKPFVEKKDLDDIVEIASRTGMRICYYEGKLKEVIDKKLCQRYLKIKTNSGDKYIPGAYDEDTNTIYLPLGTSRKYKDLINNGKYVFKRNLID